MPRISRPIQLIPRGLLGFFQVKNNGVNPTDLPDELQPILEMRDWYFQSQPEALPVGSIALATGANGFSPFTANPLVVPSDEFWFVLDYSVQASLGAGDNASIKCGFRSPTLPTAYAFSKAPFLAASTGPNAFLESSASNFWVPSGGELGFFVQGLAAAVTVTFNGFARVARLLV